jgi:hypothetical protein
MSHRALVAEFIGTFMLVTSILAAAFYAFAWPNGAAGILGVAVSVGFTVVALALAIGPISGGHFNPAVTLGLIAGGRVSASSAAGYIVAQCLGALAACAMLAIIGKTPPTFGANGYDALSMLKVGLVRYVVNSPIADRLRVLRDENLTKIDNLIAAESEFDREFCVRYYREHVRFNFGEMEKEGLIAFQHRCEKHEILPHRVLDLRLI